RFSPPSAAGRLRGSRTRLARLPIPTTAARMESQPQARGKTMSNETRNTEDMIHGIVDALKSAPAELDRFQFLTIEDALGLIVKAEWDMEDNLYTAEHLA